MAEQSAPSPSVPREAALEAAERAAENVQTLAAELAASRTKADDLERQLAIKDTESVDATRVARARMPPDGRRYCRMSWPCCAPRRKTFGSSSCRRKRGLIPRQPSLRPCVPNWRARARKRPDLPLLSRKKRTSFHRLGRRWWPLRAGTESALQRVASLSNEMDQIQLDLEAQRSDHRQAVERLQAEFEAKEAAALARVQQAEKQAAGGTQGQRASDPASHGRENREVAEYGRRLAETSSQLDSVRQQLGRAQAETRKAVAMAQAARESEARAFQQAEEARQRATEDMCETSAPGWSSCSVCGTQTRESTGPGADERLIEDEKDGGVTGGQYEPDGGEMDDAERGVPAFGGRGEGGS